MSNNFNLDEFENLLIKGENNKKEQEKAWQKEYRENNRDKINAYQKEYYKNNKDKINIRQKKIS